MTTSDVIVVGAGPVGLATAVTLAQNGIDVTVLDRQREGANTSRAAVVHARTLEVLDTLGVADPLVARGIRSGRFTIRDRDRILVPVDFTSLPTRYPFALMVPQPVTEAILLERLIALGGRVQRPTTVVGVTGSTVHTSDGTVLHARYVVGADGMHSTVRKQAGIAYPDDGRPGQSFSLADVHVRSALPRDEVVLFFSGSGMLVWAPLPDGTVRIVAEVLDPPERPAIGHLQQLLDQRGPLRDRSVVTDLVWGSRFRVHHQVAAAFRAGPVLLAGDAGHVHSPAGGQGMNLGLQDAVALGQALTDALRQGTEQPLDAYAAARPPVAREVVRFADRLTRLATVPALARMPRNTVLRTLAGNGRFRRALARRLSGLVYRPT